MNTPFWNLEYRLIPCFTLGWRHSWRLVGRHVAIELNITEYLPEKAKDYGGTSGGIEFHYTSPPEHMGENAAPSHNRCHILERPCWHDGSSLWVSEYWIPRWEECRKDPKIIFDLLIYRMNERFGYTAKKEEEERKRNDRL